MIVFTNSGNGQAIIPQIVATIFGREIVHPTFAWIGYESYKSPALQFYREVLARGLPLYPSTLNAT